MFSHYPYTPLSTERHKTVERWAVAVLSGQATLPPAYVANSLPLGSSDPNVKQVTDLISDIYTMSLEERILVRAFFTTVRRGRSCAAIGDIPIEVFYTALALEDKQKEHKSISSVPDKLLGSILLLCIGRSVGVLSGDLLRHLPNLSLVCRRWKSVLETQIKTCDLSPLHVEVSLRVQGQLKRLVTQGYFQNVKTLRVELHSRPRFGENLRVATPDPGVYLLDFFPYFPLITALNLDADESISAVSKLPEIVGQMANLKALTLSGTIWKDMFSRLNETCNKTALEGLERLDLPSFVSPISLTVPNLPIPPKLKHWHGGWYHLYQSWFGTGWASKRFVSPRFSPSFRLYQTHGQLPLSTAATTLETFHLNGNLPDDSAPFITESLSHCPNLRSVSVFAEPFSVALDSILPLTQIRSLSLGYVRELTETTVWARLNGGLPSLESLTFRFFPIGLNSLDVSAFKPWQNVTRLEVPRWSDYGRPAQPAESFAFLAKILPLFPKLQVFKTTATLHQAIEAFVPFQNRELRTLEVKSTLGWLKSLAKWRKATDLTILHPQFAIVTTYDVSILRHEVFLDFDLPADASG